MTRRVKTTINPHFRNIFHAATAARSHVRTHDLLLQASSRKMRASHFTSRLLNYFPTIVDRLDLWIYSATNCDDSLRDTWGRPVVNVVIVTLHQRRPGRLVDFTSRGNARWLLQSKAAVLCLYYTITLNSPPRSTPFLGIT